MVVDPLGLRGHCGRAAERRRRWRGSSRDRHRGRSRRGWSISRVAGARYDAHEGCARHSAGRAGVRFRAGGGRLIGARSSRARGRADHRQRRRRQAARRVPGAGGAAMRSRMLRAAGVPSFRTPEACADAIAAALSRRARALIDGSVRCKRSARLSEATGLDSPCERRGARQPGHGGCGRLCWMSLKPTRCSTASALPAHRRSPSMPAIDASACPALRLSGRGQGPVGRDRAQVRRRRRRAGCARRRGAARRYPAHRRDVANASPARASSACWCSR